MLKFIGEIRTPYNTLEECPKFIDENGPMCQIVLEKEYEAGLLGLEAGQKILVLYWFESKFEGQLIQNRRGRGKELGVFALRSPLRPNPIAVSVLKIEKIENNVIDVRGFDCLNGTKLLDIKREMNEEDVQRMLEEDAAYERKMLGKF